MSTAEVDDTEWRRLLNALDGGQLTTPLTPMLASRLSLKTLERRVDIAGLTPDALRALATAVLAERAARPPSPELVWTGPEGKAGRGRRTAIILRELFESAQHDVWLAGYSVDHGTELFAPLHQAMVERGVRARFLLHTQYRYNETRPPTVEAAADLLLNRFLAKNWPFEGPKPDLYYDPRSLQPNVRSNMHIKALVVDEARVLIGSANFTKQGTERSFEAGAYLDDPRFAKRLVTELNGLVDEGHVYKYGHPRPA